MITLREDLIENPPVLIENISPQRKRQVRACLSLSLLGIFFGLSLLSSSQASDQFLVDRGRSIQIKERDRPPRWNECQDCHPSKKRQFITNKVKTKLEHAKNFSKHGRAEVACHNCHDVNNNNYLRSTPSNPVKWENSSGVCQRCHADRFRDWKKGAHGKRIGGWRGDVTQYQCVDCHNPHSVRFRIMDAVPITNIPPGRQQSEGEEQHKLNGATEK